MKTEDEWFINLKEAEGVLDKNDTGMPPADTKVGRWIRSHKQNYIKKRCAVWNNPKIKKAWKSFCKKYKPTLEKWCGFPNKEERDKYINLPFKEWCEKEHPVFTSKYKDETLKYDTMTNNQKVYVMKNKIKMEQIYTYFNMLRLMKHDYTITLEELCNIHIKPVLHLMGDTICDSDFSKVKTIGIQKWLTRHSRGINDIRACLELPFTFKNILAYDFESKKFIYDSHWEAKVANLLFTNLHPDYDYTIHQRYPNSFYEFIKRENRSWSFKLDFTIFEKSTGKVICNIEVWQNSMKEVKKIKNMLSDKQTIFHKRIIDYCEKQGARNDKEAFWKTQPISFIGIEGCNTDTKKGKEIILNKLRKIVLLKKKELSKEC